MRKLLCFMLAAVMTCTLIPSSMTEVSAASMPSSYNKLTAEEKSAFNKLYKQTSTSSLQKVSVNYSHTVDGRSNVNGWHWTAWHKATKGAGINKKSNSGAGVGSGNYAGFTKKKVNSWRVDNAHIQAVKDMNKGKFPESRDYTYPVNTSSSKLDFWMDKVGYYDIMGDPRYSKVTMNGYRTFNWTEKIKKEHIKEDTDTQKYKKTSGKYNGTVGWGYTKTSGEMANVIKIRLRSRFGLVLTNTEAKVFERKLKDSYDDYYRDGSVYQMTASMTFTEGNSNAYVKIAISGDTSDKVNPNLVIVTVKRKTKTYTYETKSHTKKQQIAKTSIPANTYATEIQKYKTFYLTPKSNVSSNKIKMGNGGFWLNVNPYYHHSSPSVSDGGYSWTFSTNVNSGKAAVNLYASITQKYKFIDDIADNSLTTNTPGVVNPTPDGKIPNINPSGGNNNNGGNNNGGNNPNGGENNTPDGKPNGNNSGGNASGGGSNPNGGKNPDGNSSIGDEKNSPPIHIEIDAKDKEPVFKIVPKTVHLFDIDRYNGK